MENVILEFLKGWGPPGMMALVLWWELSKSEKREHAAGMRIQLLENKLTENYDERIEAATQQTTALLTSAQATRELIEVVEKLQDAVQKRR